MLTRNYIDDSVRNSQSLVKFFGIANHLMENLPGNAIMRGADNKLFNLTSNEKVILWQSNRFPLFVTCIKRTKNKQFSHQCRYVLVTVNCIQTIVSIWRENMFRYLSADIICSEKRTVFRQRSSRKTDLWGTDNVKEQISAHIFKAILRLFCLLSFKYFSKHAQFWKFGNNLRYSQVIGSISAALSLVSGLLSLLYRGRSAGSFPEQRLVIEPTPQAYPIYSWGIFSHVVRFNQSRTNENLW